MDDFQGLLARDFGLQPQGKSAPMSSSRPAPTSGPAWDPPLDPDPFDDVFGRPAPKAPAHGFDPKAPAGPVFDRPVYDDDLFEGVPGLKPVSSQFDDVFASNAAGRGGTDRPPQADEGDDLLASLGGTPLRPRDRSPVEKQKQRGPPEPDVGLDDLIPGFGVSVPASKREHSDADPLHSSGTSDKSAATISNDPFADFGTIPVSVLPSPAVDPLENLKFTSKEKKSSMPSAVLDDMNVFDELKKSNAFDINDVETDRKYTSSAEGSNRGSSPAEGSNRGSSSAEGSHRGRKSNAFDDIAGNLPGKKVSDEPEKKEFVENFQEQPFLDTYLDPTVPKTYMGQHGSHTESKINRYNAREGQARELDDIWLTVAEVPLHTHPTRAPPPSRPPPPLDPRLASFASAVRVASSNSNSKMNIGSYSFHQHSENRTFPGRPNGMARRFGMSLVDGPEENTTDRSRSSVGEHAGIFYNDELHEGNSAAATSAAAMKEAMDRAEAKFKYAREQREREKEHKSFRNRESGRLQQTDNFIPDFQEVEIKETRLNFDFEREQREKEAKEERRRIEREQQKAAAEKAMREAWERAAAEKAMKEAQERAATEKAIREAQERAAAEARIRAQRAAVEKANAEARERAARAAALKAEAEARERAAREVKEKALREAREREREAREKEAREREARDREAREREAWEREACEREAREREAREREAKEREAREKAIRDREAREKAIRDRERAAVERAAEDARRRAARAAFEKANAEARERAAAAAAAAAKEKQSKNDNDLDSFFGMGTRASSQPKQRTASVDPFDAQVQNQGGTNGARSSTGPTSSIKKASSATNILDDLSSVFGAPSSGEFQEIEGESEERRKARFERHQRTLERAAKALAEKNERDIQLQREQAERHRIAETVDVEIRRWASGKEGNLRALLSTLQYVLWSECGWQPVSLTDLITAAAVKKVYRKATLCIHPDKVQQKGANLQQKYIAEKVFDLLKEAWNKFNSEELF